MKTSAAKPILIALALLLLSLTTVVLMEPAAVPDVEKPAQYLQLSALKVTPQEYSPTLVFTGISQARWFSQLKAQTSGQIVSLDKRIQPGSLVANQQELLKLDPIHLQSELSSANSQIKQAELNYLQQKHEQTVAVNMLDKNNRSAFARKEPQLAAAKAELARAQLAYKSTQQRLRDSQVNAPFNAIIMHSYVSPNQHIEQGELLFDLASSESIDIKLPVSDLHWRRLQASLSAPQITVVDRQNQRWPATVRYIVPQVDPVTRQRQVVLSVANPYQHPPRLLPEQQVNIEVTLSAQENVVKLPISALTKDGQVWSINADNELALEQVNIVNESGNQVWLQFTQQPKQARVIALFPLQSMLQGLRVTPQFEQEVAQ
ncbi:MULTISPECIES: efflux RND transporter periplasmic adaptor subunit [unclassified Agarivorans]|uniref:efflux RND transporter periplasmic adaptor subunit n=1 Tax=unclassified Agarivorans TaxID=2636026 RepID=UPI0026E28A39|nr:MULTISPECIES: efflux RND transporter periplasmic adaptor subunit [unclassified Agarivorans]MDO6684598.1 efflux RND transporter periplasmic adaptor subunit [Agarivorans sp. 3_MG-2023]MDO6714763.1 efflux RND transporter periplasmic adaptor subunit [Agarivorans sp. 2_MG-2023]